MTKTLLPLYAALLLLPATSFAAPADGGESHVNDEGAIVTQQGEDRKLTFVDGDSIDGETFKPGGAIVRGTRRDRLESMISVRGVFIPQLIALSADI